MRFLDIIKCLYRLPEYRETLINTNEQLENTNEQLESTNQLATLERANAAARIDALESYVSALTLDRIEPVEAELKTVRYALERYASTLSRSRVGAEFANQNMSRKSEAVDGVEQNYPLPEGVESREQALNIFRSVSIDGAPIDELLSYAEADCDRFLHTLNLVRSDAKHILEIGANPYFSSILMKEYRSAELDFTNFFGPGVERGTQAVRYENHAGEKREWQIEYANINTEESALPAKDGAFDHVVFCEVLEHLTNDPLFALIEINRVLEMGGTLVLSTPNVARLENIAALVAGANIYDPYSGYGPYGRHNREYTCHELSWLIQYTGFEVETFFTLDASPNNASRYYDVDMLKPLVQFRAQDLGHYMFVRAIKRHAVGASLKRPMWLYRSLHEHQQMANLSLLDDPLSGREEG